MSVAGNSKAGTLLQEADLEDNSWKVNLGQSSLDLTSLSRSDHWWTGLAPTSGNCPGVSTDRRIYALRAPNLESASRSEVLDYFNNGWTITEVLFSGLVGEEAFYRPPYHHLRHPLVFYYIHPAVFYVNKFVLAGLIDGPVDEAFEKLFDIGVDEMSWDDMSKNNIKWPSIDECVAYRRKVYSLIVDIITQTKDLEPGHKQITMNDKLWSLFMGFEHERIHIETTSVLMRELPLRLVNPPCNYPEVDSSSAKYSGIENKVDEEGYPKNSFVSISSGLVEIGKPLDWPSYGWDNEYGSRTVQVEEFAVSKNLISNGEILEFINDGGYRNRDYWSEEGWQWRSFRDVSMPTFWSCSEGTYRLRTTFEVIGMPWSWPAVLNFHESKAFAKWRSERDNVEIPYRLLTEAEHMRLRQESGFEQIVDSNQVVDKDHFNINLRSGSESPVNKFDDKGKLVNDLFGNVWQWQEDHFNPLPGFKVHEIYDDFSTPCFDGKHHMILGGSFISIGDEASPFARFHFRPHFFQHAGLRLVRPTSTECSAAYLNS